MNDSLYNFNDKSDIEDQSLKLNMDELFALKLDIGNTQNWSKLYNKDHTPQEGVGYNNSQFDIMIEEVVTSKILLKEVIFKK